MHPPREPAPYCVLSGGLSETPHSFTETSSTGVGGEECKVNQVQVNVEAAFRLHSNTMFYRILRLKTSEFLMISMVF